MSELARRAAIAGTVAALAIAGVVVATTTNGGGPGSAAAATDRWLPLAPSPLTRTEVAAARIGQRIYVVGGFDRTSGETTSAVARYDIRRDEWDRVRSMPVAVNHPTAVSRRGKLYVHGGFTDERSLVGATAALQRYDPRKDRWRRLPGSSVPRAAHALGAIGGKLFAAGGANSESARLTSLEIYDISAREWRRGPSMDVGRNHVAGAVVGRRLYVLGGRPGNLDAAERYDPKRREWRAVAPLETPRSGFAAAVVGGEIVAFGGETPSGTIAPVERYDPDTNTWTGLPDMLTPRHGLGAASRKHRVFALEGGPEPGFHFSSALEYLDIAR